MSKETCTLCGKPSADHGETLADALVTCYGMTREVAEEIAADLATPVTSRPCT